MSKEAPGKMFADIIDPNARLEAIQQNAHSQSKEKVPYYFTKDELDGMRQTSIQIADEIDEMEDNKKIIVKQHNDAIKPKKERSRELRKEIRAGKIEVSKTLYAFDDQERGMMDYYDGEGSHIYSRPLMANERQARIMQINSGTHD